MLFVGQSFFSISFKNFMAFTNLYGVSFYLGRYLSNLWPSNPFYWFPCTGVTNCCNLPKNNTNLWDYTISWLSQVCLLGVLSAGSIAWHSGSSGERWIFVLSKKMLLFSTSRLTFFILKASTLDQVFLILPFFSPLLFHIWKHCDHTGPSYIGHLWSFVRSDV